MDIDPREAAAFDAVIAYSIAGRKFWELTDEAIERDLSGYPPLTGEGRKLLESMGNAPFSEKRSVRAQTKISSREVCGMYREGSDDKISAELRDEIARKRDEIQARLRKKS